MLKPQTLEQPRFSLSRRSWYGTRFEDIFRVNDS